MKKRSARLAPRRSTKNTGLALEHLEDRVVLSVNDLGLISGVVFDDLNQDGTLDSGEEIAGASVELRVDTNSNGIFDAGDELLDTATTGAGGGYSFNGLTSGNYFTVQTAQAVGTKALPELVSGLIMTSGNVSGVMIDSFQTDTGPVTDSTADGNSDSGAFTSATSLGGELDFVATLVEELGTDPGSVSISTTGGQLAINSATNSRGVFELTWDGIDSNGATNANALGGVDLTSLAGSFGQGICLTGFVPTTAFTSLVVTVQSTDGATSSATLLSSVTNAANDFYVPFTGLNSDGVGFTQTTNGGADFTDVSSVKLEVRATTFGLDATLDSFGVVGGTSDVANFGNVLGSGELAIEVLVNGVDAGASSPASFIEQANAVHTYFVTNPGTLGVSGVLVVDNAGTDADITDDFSPLFTGGDTNSDGVLDPDETWTFRSTRTVEVGQFTSISTVTGNDGANELSDSEDSSHVGLESFLTYGWHNQDFAADVNDDGQVSPLDPLVLINELTNRVFSDEESSLLEPVTTRPVEFYDVNDDGFASPLDALLAIRALEQSDVPEVDLDATEAGIDSTVNFGVGDTSVVIAPEATIENLSRSVVTSISIVLTNPVDGDSESLSVDTLGTAIEAIFIPSSESGDGSARLTLNGYERLDAYEELLRQVRYSNTSVAPGAATRTIEVVVNDGSSVSQTAMSNILFEVPA